MRYYSPFKVSRAIVASGDKDYYRRRAEAERAAALSSTDVAVMRVHLELAREYEWRAATEPRPEAESPRLAG